MNLLTLARFCFVVIMGCKGAGGYISVLKIIRSNAPEGEILYEKNE